MHDSQLQEFSALDIRPNRSISFQCFEVGIVAFQSERQCRHAQNLVENERVVECFVADGDDDCQKQNWCGTINYYTHRLDYVSEITTKKYIF